MLNIYPAFADQAKQYGFLNNLFTYRTNGIYSSVELFFLSLVLI